MLLNALFESELNVNTLTGAAIGPLLAGWVTNDFVSSFEMLTVMIVAIILW